MKVNKVTKLIMVALLTVTLATPVFASAETSQDAGTMNVESYGEFDSMGDINNYNYDDPSVTIPKSSLGTSGASAIPSKYDLRELGRSTSVKNQGKYDICWAFSTIASLESNLITKGLASKNIDLSEAHLAFFTIRGQNGKAVSSYAGKDTFLLWDDASNYYDSTASLARWYGAVKEGVMPLKKINSSKYHSDKIRIKHPYLLTNAEFMYTKSTAKKLDTAGMNAVKKSIIENGALASSIDIGKSLKDFKKRFGSSAFSKMTSYYYAGNKLNHAITVVGWDDNYPKSKFKSQRPKGNGAWLVKNSWGAYDAGIKVHDKGFFWVSYYSPSVNEFTSFQGEKASGRAVYQYDGVGIGDNMLTDNTPVYGANVFKARKDMLIDRVGTWTAQSNMKVNIKIYVNKQNQYPTSGTLLYNKTFRQTYAGFHTIDLRKKVGIPKGSKFTVAIRVNSDNGKYYYPFETKARLPKPHVYPAVKKAGQSYIKVGKDRWVDTKYVRYEKVGNYYYTLYNALAKAYSVNSGKVSQKINGPKRIKMKRGRSRKVGAIKVKGNGRMVYRTTNRKVATVSKTGIIKAKKRGKAKIVINALPTITCKGATKTVTVVVK